MDGNTQQDQSNANEQKEPAQPQLTLGGKTVGVTFNPSNNGEVDNIKKAAATLVDVICGTSGEKLTSTTDAEIIERRKKAKDFVEMASMLAVKAATWQN